MGYFVEYQGVESPWPSRCSYARKS